jgi:hypothetical protein
LNFESGDAAGAEAAAAGEGAAASAADAAPGQVAAIRAARHRARHDGTGSGHGIFMGADAAPPAGRTEVQKSVESETFAHL